MGLIRAHDRERHLPFRKPGGEAALSGGALRFQPAPPEEVEDRLAAQGRPGLPDPADLGKLARLEVVSAQLAGEPHHHGLVEERLVIVGIAVLQTGVAAHLLPEIRRFQEALILFQAETMAIERPQRLHQQDLEGRTVLPIAGTFGIGSVGRVDGHRIRHALDGALHGLAAQVRMGVIDGQAATATPP